MKTSRIAVAVISFVAASHAAYIPSVASAHPTYGHTAPQVRNASARLDEATHQAVRNDRFNGVVLVQQGGTLLLRKSYGNDMRSNTVSATFALPGVTNLFTVAAIEQLAEHGKVAPRVLTEARARQDASGQRAAIQLIERVSGEKYAAYMQSHMFQPLGMTHTSIRRSSTGAPEVYSTVDDLNRWDQSVIDCGLISPESLFTTIAQGGEAFEASGTDGNAAAGERLLLNSRTTIIVLTNNGKSVDQLLNALQKIVAPSHSMTSASTAW